MTQPYRIELLGKQDRAAFANGSDPLDRYLRESATQDMRRRIASCFIAIDAEDVVVGYYTIAATSLLLDRPSPERTKRLPRYPLVPAVLLGRLAVALTHQGKRFDGMLVADALLRATRAEVMAYAMVVDAKDDAAMRFYQHLGFEPLTHDPRRVIRSL